MSFNALCGVACVHEPSNSWENGTSVGGQYTAGTGAWLTEINTNTKTNRNSDRLVVLTQATQLDTKCLQPISAAWRCDSQQPRSAKAVSCIIYYNLLAPMDMTGHACIWRTVVAPTELHMAELQNTLTYGWLHVDMACCCIEIDSDYGFEDCRLPTLVMLEVHRPRWILPSFQHLSSRLAFNHCIYCIYLNWWRDWQTDFNKSLNSTGAWWSWHSKQLKTYCSLGAQTDKRSSSKASGASVKYSRCMVV